MFFQRESGQLAAAQNSNSNNQGFVGQDFGDLSNLANVSLIGGFIGRENGIFIPWSKICAAGKHTYNKIVLNWQINQPALSTDGD